MVDLPDPDRPVSQTHSPSPPRDGAALFFEPATGYHLDLIDEAEVQEPWVATVNTAFRRLNDVLFGPQDYAVIARR